MKPHRLTFRTQATFAQFKLDIYLIAQKKKQALEVAVLIVNTDMTETVLCDLNENIKVRGEGSLPRILKNLQTMVKSDISVHLLIT